MLNLNFTYCTQRASARCRSDRRPDPSPAEGSRLCGAMYGSKDTMSDRVAGTRYGLVFASGGICRAFFPSCIRPCRAGCIISPRRTHKTAQQQRSLYYLSLLCPFTVLSTHEYRSLSPAVGYALFLGSLGMLDTVPLSRDLFRERSFSSRNRLICCKPSALILRASCSHLKIVIYSIHSCDGMAKN